MTSVYFDRDLRRIYEVPTNSTFTVNGGGYRIYTPVGQGENPSFLDLQQDVWSRFQDWFHIDQSSTIAITRSGGGFRGQDRLGNDQFQTNDFVLQTDIGWRIVLADYDHELNILGNLFPVPTVPFLFDDSRLTSRAYPRLVGADSLLTYSFSSGSGISQQQADQLATAAEAAEDMRDRMGLNPSSPVVASRVGSTTTETFNGKTLTHTVDGDTVTTQRS